MSYLNLLGGEGTNNTYKVSKYQIDKYIIHNTFLNMFETLGVLVIFLLRGPQKVCALVEPHLKFAESHLKSHLQVQVAGNFHEIKPERVAEASQTKQTERPRVLPQCHRNQQCLSLLSKFVLRQVQVVYFQVSVNSCCSQYMPYLVLNVKVRAHYRARARAGAGCGNMCAGK